ncbi:ATPase family AAA domain-containing protein 1-B [Lingula anatina]|uniref:ATPase family AAA domain-containing protein 1-B n=1 Tax=Lingula anatina TaxID=7574 RepID=A0A1S3IB45_LINAN|nr:ATPase family AAA domain-containing protein 1-B [Lingula anatina]|eukprot:XP_013395490.1 ATPase family AAA domain-containing protein 1-B [Lingula anatina]
MASSSAIASDGGLLSKLLSFIEHFKPRGLLISKAGEPGYALAHPEEVKIIQGLQRHELIAKLIHSLIGVSVTLIATYFTVKWLKNVLDPTSSDKEKALQKAKDLMKKIGVKETVKLTDYELCVAANLVDLCSIEMDWTDIGGLQEVKEDIRETVIFPFKRHDLVMGSSLLRAPKGVLLYGPPGCGKTMVAKAMAKEAGARFINLQITSLLDKWYGESQKRAEAVFSLAVKIQPTIIFIDEIDAFLRSRNSSDHEATALMKTQFMTLWDGLVTDPNCRVMIIGATNRASDVDPAILRRMPSMFHIAKPGQNQRKHILEIILADEELDSSVDLTEVAKLTNGFSGSDLRELCRNAALYRIKEYIQEEIRRDGMDSTSTFPDENGSPSLRRISMADIEKSLEKMTNCTHIHGFQQTNFHLD